VRSVSDTLNDKSKRIGHTIALLSDFGTADYFVGSVKGVILSLNPNVKLVDITHEIPPQDLEAGAFTLLASRSAFADGTIFVAVVDPGVGSGRRPILVKSGEQFFIGPDNGLLSYLYDKPHKTFHLTKEKYFRDTLSPTFHGRDVFAPVAAHLSLGVKASAFGPKIVDEIRLPPLQPINVQERVWDAKVIHIDRFGNCVTNITRKTLTAGREKRARLRIKGKTITAFRRFFTDDAESKEKLFAMWGSAGFLEIAALNRSAAKKLKVKRGDRVRLEVT
jgi:S-adenosyl-L-methionine hydrolase (adenosine-forming)